MKNALRPSLVAASLLIGCCIALAQGPTTDQKSKTTPSPVLATQPSTTNEVKVNGHTWKVSDLQPLKVSDTKSEPQARPQANRTRAKQGPTSPASSAHPPSGQ